MTDQAIFWLIFGFAYILLAPLTLIGMEKIHRAMSMEEQLKQNRIEKMLLLGRCRNLRRRLRRKRRLRKPRVDTRHLEKVR